MLLVPIVQCSCNALLSGCVGGSTSKQKVLDMPCRPSMVNMPSREPAGATINSIFEYLVPVLGETTGRLAVQADVKMQAVPSSEG